MRKFMGTAGIGTAGITAAGLGLIVSMAAVAAPDQQTPEATAYFSYSFGGVKTAPNKLHYGLRLDHDRFFVPAEQPLPPLMQLDFTRRGLGAISVNGLDVLRPAFRLKQNEEIEDAEIAEEEGFFDSVGNWFGGLFGDDEDEGEELADDSASEASAETEVADAEQSEGYDIIDWGLVAIGLTGIGFVVAEVLDGEDDPGQRPMGITAEGEACLLGLGDVECLPVCGPTPPFPAGSCLPAQLQLVQTGGGRLYTKSQEAPEHLEWLDSGTGQMGDLRQQ